MLPHLWCNEGRLRALRRLRITSAGGISLHSPICRRKLGNAFSKLDALETLDELETLDGLEALE